MLKKSNKKIILYHVLFILFNSDKIYCPFLKWAQVIIFCNFHSLPDNSNVFYISTSILNTQSFLEEARVDFDNFLILKWTFPLVLDVDNARIGTNYKENNPIFYISVELECRMAREKQFFEGLYQTLVFKW